MARAFIVVVVFTVLLVSCTQRTICPAYQSAYIYDKEALRKKFSYFNEDATPKVYTASKTKYLIAEPTSYRKKVRGLNTVTMKPVNPIVPDSLKAGGDKVSDEFSAAERNVNDSTAVISIDTLSSTTEDSVYVISKEREVLVLKYKPLERKYYVDTVGFNSEQDNYMWYLRDVLVLPDTRLAQQQEGEKGGEISKGVKKKKGKGLFKNLFKKKDKAKIREDSTLRVAPVEEDYGYDDFDGKKKDSTNVQVAPQQSTAPAKKGKFAFLKKKKTDKKKTEAAPAKKEESDDGF